MSAPLPMPFDRDTQERRAKRAEKDLRELGKVNPLALEEFAALEERYNFLSTQLEDVKAARKDLLDVVADVDERILQVFTEAYADVEREFKGFSRHYFPVVRDDWCSPTPMTCSPRVSRWKRGRRAEGQAPLACCPAARSR
ncbi:putative sMC structural maintenance of chromosomes partitioning protein [Mycobacteroides abscessus]|nr:hypothetical protein [Mycobacteroides abscessus]EUA66090.1 putative sMC structural maintenance of chromosomes partitioning protein [Mycobacteroides abscessus]